MSEYLADQLRVFDTGNNPDLTGTSLCIETGGCGGAVKIIACIEDPVVIHKILDHLQEKAALAGLDLLPPCRGPPQLV